MTTITHDTVMYFRNRGPSDHVFPSGFVRVIGHSTGEPIDDYTVEYVDPPEGLEARRFHVVAGELTLGQPVVDLAAWWVVVVPGFPTFYLNGAVQGITDGLHAAKIAASIIGEQASVGPSNIDRLSDILT